MRKVYARCLLPVLTAFTLNAPAQSTNALPVLVSVAVNVTPGNKVVISWTMLAKVNTDYFDVERSRDGISWQSVAIIKADVNAVVPTTYTALDQSPLKGSAFYQVRIKDLNGTVTVTAIKTVWINGLASASLYPNPASQQVNILPGQLPHADWSVSIINSSGQLMVQKRYSKNTTLASLPVNAYAAGNYIVQIAEGSSLQSAQLMIHHQ